MPQRSKAVLITGCSSGIGEATARRLVEKGWTVYASARRVDAIEHLREAGAQTLQLDVTDESSMTRAVAAVEREHGAVGVLVNNAGYSQGGALERVPIEAARRQFETNVFGAVRMAQQVLPGMRRQRYGKIVNIGSMGGRFTFPGGGWYHATKHALEAISDALRFEVRGFGVDVILLEPGLIVTNFGHAAVAATIAARRDGEGDGTDDADAYGAFEAAVTAATAGVYEGPMRHMGARPESVARALERAISRRRPPTRRLITPSARLALVRRALPDRVWDALMRAQFPQPR
jgi:NADP-dependent 3-hydroxy acid dehydrogenase YdfG